MRSIATVIIMMTLSTGMFGCIVVSDYDDIVLIPSRRRVKIKRDGRIRIPRAPKHGHRHHHHHGIDLVFSSALGVYVVADLTDVYYYDDAYFRFSGGHWELATHFRGPWKVVVQKRVPKKLWENHRGRGRGGDH